MKDSKPMPGKRPDENEFREQLKVDLQIILSASENITLNHAMIRLILQRCSDQAWQSFRRGASISSVRGRLYRNAVATLVKQYMAEMIAVTESTKNENKT
jgi:hypothetical protein